eukprot:TRINITY_DN48339_c0_g1_i1.p1 TRINITY_DN48339_c0_g1~~TRINITY_DN48339_c0_g1_i1.p1  ORF type:complete len:342 (-),score=57.83 TRINITY_DN48339_c0_g1_i1:27-1052(-)
MLPNNGIGPRRFQGNAFQALQSPQVSPCMCPTPCPAQGYAVAPMQLHSYELPQSPSVAVSMFPQFPGTASPGTSILELIPGPCNSSVAATAIPATSPLPRTRASTCDLSRVVVDQSCKSNFARQRAATTSFVNFGQQPAPNLQGSAPSPASTQNLQACPSSPVATSTISSNHSTLLQQTMTMVSATVVSTAAAPAASPTTVFVPSASPASQGVTRQAPPILMSQSQGFTRQLSPTSPVSMPGSPSWTTVTTQRRQPTVPKMSDLPPPAAASAPTQQTTGDLGDMYYDQKEQFGRGWTREMKGSRSVKMKKKVDYQVDKRRQQSMRDKAAMMADVDEDDFFD